MHGRTGEQRTKLAEETASWESEDED